MPHTNLFHKHCQGLPQHCQGLPFIVVHLLKVLWTLPSIPSLFSASRLHKICGRYKYFAHDLPTIYTSISRFPMRETNFTVFQPQNFIHIILYTVFPTLNMLCASFDLKEAWFFGRLWTESTFCRLNLRATSEILLSYSVFSTSTFVAFHFFRSGDSNPGC